MNSKLKILDCTLRDGGYYTNWDFDTNVVDAYIQAMNNLPIDYLEVGYRNIPSKEYLGKFGYTPISVLQHLRSTCSKKIVVMLDEKNTLPTDLDYLLCPILGLADMVRIAIDPKNFDRALVLAKAVKTMGFEVGFNTIYMSKWHEYNAFLDKLNLLDSVADLFCMVDSFGGVSPQDIKEIYGIVKSKTTCPIGFHGHNNLQMGLINTLTAMECGADYVDATILGMGRGAGNLNMELLLTYLNKEGLEVDFNVLGDVITAFQPLLDQYKWGSNLPYMISGANSIPQKGVMEWVSNRAYSFNSIVRALDNKRNKVEDNARYPQFQPVEADEVMVVGGGNSSIAHLEAIKEFILHHPLMPIIFVTARHVAHFKEIANLKYYCLVGNEAKRMMKNLKAEEYEGTCILPPYPRMMGTEVPIYAAGSTFELQEITFTDHYSDSCTTLALSMALGMKASNVYVVGYDGYKGEILSEKEMDLSNENRFLFETFQKEYGDKVNLVSLTPSLYKSLKVESIYQNL